MRRLLATLVLSLVLSPVLALGAQQPTPPAPPPSACDTATRSHEFDFWLGTWDVYPTAAPIASAPRIGVNIITSIEKGCALLEQWTDASGNTGRSFNWYDTNLGSWRQLWLDQGGNTLDYTRGEYRDGAMRFSGWTLGPRGRRLEQKLTFFNVHPDTVRQLFEASSDSGRTWRNTFDGRYVRRATPR